MDEKLPGMEWHLAFQPRADGAGLLQTWTFLTGSSGTKRDDSSKSELLGGRGGGQWGNQRLRVKELFSPGGVEAALVHAG